MEYIHRNLERKFLRLNDFFKVLLVTGARQVGKTTMLKHLAEGTNRVYVTMDDLMARDLANRDPALFFQRYKPPILIDEIQKAPRLLEEIKVLCDRSEEKGLFWLTGSQHFQMMNHVRETLAGRIGILHLYGLSQQEKQGISFEEETDFSLDSMVKRKSQMEESDIVRVFQHIWEGGLPQVQGVDEELRQAYFSSYIETYLYRDAADMGGISDVYKFGRLLKAAAALVSEQVNYSTLAAAADVSIPTAKNWLQVLEGLDIVYFLPPFFNNALKRLSKTPKLYFTDTGLCAYLSMWLTPETLMAGAASGHYYENYVVGELLKSYAVGKKKANLSYYRDSYGREIDVVIEADGALHPLEIKKSASPDRREMQKFSLLDKTALPRGRGGIVCMARDVMPIDEENAFIPSQIL